MGLMDDLKEERWGPPVRCPVRKICDLLTGKDGDELWTAVNDKLIPATIIERVIARRNMTLKAASINKHRRGDCGCRN